jgi:hypothetical protein
MPVLSGSNHNPFDLIGAELVAPSIVELRRARRRMVRHCRRLFERAAVLEISGDPSRPETVVAELGRDAGAGLRRIIAYAFACGSTVRVSLAVPRPIVRNSGPLGSPRSSAPSR